MDVPFHIHTCTLKYTTLKYNNLPPPHPKKKIKKKTMFLNKQEKSRFFFSIFLRNIFNFLQSHEKIRITYCKATPSFQSVVKLVMLHSGITACNHANIQFLC